MSSEIKTLRLRNLEDLLVWWPKMIPGVEKLLETQKNIPLVVDCEYVFKKILDTLQNDEDRHYHMLILDPLANVIGFVLVCDATLKFKPPTAVVFGVWSDGSVKNLGDFLHSLVVTWSKDHGYEYLTAQSYRFNGGAFRFFESKYGFTRHSITFCKKL